MKNNKIVFMLIFSIYIIFLVPNIVLANVGNITITNDYDTRNISSFSTISNIEYSNHISQSHTKRQIKDKYESTVSYNYATSPYKVQPSNKAPYIAGSLQDGVINDTLNRINFYRWLSGMDEVELNTDKIERNQKGAVILSKLGTLTHEPEKPDDMDDDFYNEAFAGCYIGYQAGDTYSGNCSMGNERLYSAIDGYINDLNNITVGAGAVGHRMSLLYPYATRTSFGQCNRFNTLSMYYEFQDEGNPLDEDYYAFPTPGYFPVEQFYVREYWSLYMANRTYLKTDANTKIQFIYDGKTYDAVDVSAEYGYMAMSFRMPNELRSLLGGDNAKMPEVTIEVKVTGIIDETTGDILNYSYPVKFFSLSKVLNSITLSKTKINMVEKGQTKLEIIKDPTNAVVDGTAKWESTNMDVATVDDNGTITAKSKGNTTIKVTLEGVSASCEVVVTDVLKGDVNKDGLINSTDAAIVLDFYKNDNAVEEDFTLGDMNDDNLLNSTDAAMILDIYKNS